MNLSDYTDDQLKSELKRRAQERKDKQEEVMRCRHCEHCIQRNFLNSYFCAVRFHGKKCRHNYVVSNSKPACELFKKKSE